MKQDCVILLRVSLFLFATLKKDLNIETKESSFINMNSFVKFMKYPNPNLNRRILSTRMAIGSIWFCDFTRFRS